MQPSGDYEEIEIRGAAGAVVRAICREPDGDARASVVILPSEPKLAAALARRGYRTLTFAGEHLDLVLDCVRERADGRPVIALGPPALVIPAKADALVFLGGRVWRALRATLTTPVKLPVAQVLGRFELPLVKLALGPTHLVRTDGRGEHAHGAIAEAIEWAILQARP